jgi:hypothetical protein
MADTRATATVENLREADVVVTRYEGKSTLYLELGNLVSVAAGRETGDAAAEAAAMRALERAAGEVAAELERRAALRKDGSDEH